MKNLFSAIIELIAGVLENLLFEVGEGVRNRDVVRILSNALLLIAAFVFGTILFLIVLGLVWKFWEWLIIPAILVAALVHYLKKDEEIAPPPQTKPLESVEIVRARAEKTYPIMEQTAYLLFGDVCQYLRGMMAPISLEAVRTAVKFDITASLVTKYHFVMFKGQCDAEVSTVKEIMETVIAQRLAAHNLPASVPALYVASDGSTWPGLVVDGVYDLGNQYRVDLVVTNEAEVTTLKAKGIARSAGTNQANPTDPDGLC